MKNLIASVMLFTMTLTSSFNAFATGDNEKSALTVNSTQAGKYHVVYDSDKVEHVRVSIFNEKGKKLKTNYIKNKDGFRLPYDLSKLPEGQYEVKVITKDAVHSTTINHIKEPAPFFKAFVNAENGNRKITVKVVRHEIMPVKISIIDKDNQVIHTDKIDVDYNFERTYDLKNFKFIADKVLISSGSNTVNYSLK